MLTALIFWRIEPDQDIGTILSSVDDNDRLDLPTIRDTLPGERIIIDSTDILSSEDIDTERGERTCLNEGYVVISNSSGNSTSVYSIFVQWLITD